MGVGNKRTITKTRRKTRDVDQVKADLLSSRHLSQFKDTKNTEDLPGLGRHYCVECARWFDTEATLITHRRGKPHKRRVHQLREEPDADPQRVPGANVGSRPNVAEGTGSAGGASADDINMAT
ncbi:Zinc finger protein bud20 [Tolypocladium capitatum]|uniref:Zinc finger protein bud20 n=1 Tax=Tolypocladium capitatum TaxID=45235 RepID=A0A2K3QGN5_9HYPO|nr:Zinc finger protein bud20 [Tolypocladium capitatum]